MKQIKTIHCPNCKKSIGMLYVDNGRIYCLIGDCLVRVFIHNCSVCGRSYHWHSEEMERQANNKKPVAYATG